MFGGMRMKKLIALGLAACVALACFASCEETPPVETTATEIKQYEVEDGILTSCVGQADANGVYVVPDTITAIGESAFAGDTKLKEIVIGSNVKAIGSGAFQYCTSLKKVTIMEGVESIGSAAFYACSSLEEITIPSTVERLESYTFYGCEALETLSLEPIRFIEDYAMWYCTALETVSLSPELVSIGEWSFAQCPKLENINLEDCTALESIGDYAFATCEMLTSVQIPQGTKSIGKLAFYECTRLTDVSIPSTVETIDFAAFNFTPWYQENSDDYLIVGDGILIKCAVHPLYLDLSGKGIRYISSSFWNAEAGGYAKEYGYRYASELESVEIPEGVTVIGTAAFEGCFSLESVNLPSTLERIEDNAFSIYSDSYVPETKILSLENCENLTYIGNYAFYGCGGLEQIELAPSVEYVGAYAFALTKAYDDFMEAAKVQENENDRYLIVGDGILIAAYIPDGQTSVSIPEGVKIIGGAALCGWDTAYVPDDNAQLSTSGQSKYNLSYKVTELTLPSTLTTICDNAFFRMTKITKIVLPDMLKTIGNGAFGYCQSLSDISGGANIEFIGDNAFSYCSAIKSFRFSSNTTEIGSGVFSGCSALESVSFPEDTVLIGEDQFIDGCTSLLEIRIAPEARPRIYTITGNISQNIKVIYYTKD